MSPSPRVVSLRRAMTIAPAALLGLGLLLASGGIAAPAPTEAVGVIRGSVELRRGAATQTLDRYAGRTAPRAPRAAQSPPAIAYLVGTPGGQSWNPSAPTALTQLDTVFATTALVVPLGGTVTFPNEDGFFHNVFSYSDTKRFDLGRYPRGETREVVFDRPGVVQVFCEVHEHMRAAILVTPNPFHALVAEDGSFTISGVPAGTHELRVWHPDGERSVPVTVRDGATVEVTVQIP